MPERARFGRPFELGGQPALDLQAFVERQTGGRLQRVEQGERRLPVAHGLGDLLALLLEEAVGVLAASHRLFAGAARACIFGHQFARDRDGARDQVAFDDRVNEVHVVRGLGGDRLARQNHVERMPKVHDARQPLGAAGAGNDAEGEFRQTEARVLVGHAIMAGERELGSRAERGAVHGRHHRTGAVLDQPQHLVEAGRRYSRVEFLDVGAGDEGSPRAAEHDRLDVRPALEIGKGLLQSRAHPAIHRIDRRVVDRHHCDAVDDRIADDLTHVCTTSASDDRAPPAPANCYRQSPGLAASPAHKRPTPPEQSLRRRCDCGLAELKTLPFPKAHLFGNIV